MTLGIFAAVLAAAFLHAFWNALIRTGVNKQTGMVILSIFQGLFGVALALTRPMPGAEVWVWLVASGLIHMAYQLFLAYAYEQGDLSRVYPIARGAAPMIVAVVGAVALADQINGWGYAGIVVLGAGIVLMANGALRSGESRRLLPFALGSACATAGYTLVDGMGVRAGGDAVAYVGWLLGLAAVFYLPVILALRGAQTLRAPAKAWGVGAIGAAASLGAYGIVVWAMLHAPIALVAALRETSILFAVLIGWLVFGERMDRTKGLAAVLIVAGVVLTRLA